MTETEVIHGSPSTYNNHKCRCEACTTAWATYIRERGYVRRHQAKKRQEKLAQKQATNLPLTLDLDGEGKFVAESFKSFAVEE